MRRSMKVTWVFLISAGPLLISCIKTGSLSETKPLEEKLSAYDSILINAYTLNPTSEQYVGVFGELLRARIRDERLFREVTLKTREAPLSSGLYLRLNMVGAKVRVYVVRVKERDSASNLLGGDAEFTFKGELIQGQGNKLIASFDAGGNSNETSDTEWRADVLPPQSEMRHMFDSLTQRALNASADQILEYLKKNK